SAGCPHGGGTGCRAARNSRPRPRHHLKEPHMIRPLLPICAALALAACSPTSLTNTTAELTAAQTAVQTAINGYGIVKGMAGGASLADPALAPTIALAEAALDPLVAKAQTALNNAQTDAATLVSLAAQITAQAQALQATSAPAV